MSQRLLQPPKLVSLFELRNWRGVLCSTCWGGSPCQICALPGARVAVPALRGLSPDSPGLLHVSPGAAPPPRDCPPWWPHPGVTQGFQVAVMNGSDNCYSRVPTALVSKHFPVHIQRPFILVDTPRNCHYSLAIVMLKKLRLHPRRRL